MTNFNVRFFLALLSTLTAFASVAQSTKFSLEDSLRGAITGERSCGMFLTII